MFKDIRATDNVRCGFRIYRNFKLCEGFTPDQETPNKHSLALNHKTNAITATSEGNKYYSMNCNILVNPEKHRKTCDQCFQYIRSKRKAIRQNTMPKENTKFTNNKLLGHTKLVEKLETATKRAKVAENKIKKLKEKYNKEMIELKEEQAKAIKFIFDDLDKKRTFKEDDNMAILWESQKEYHQLGNKRSMHWHPKYET